MKQSRWIVGIAGIALLGGVAITACSEKKVATPVSASTKPGCESAEQRMTPYPSTSRELLINLMLALESGDMEKPEFYTEDNLKRISGASEIKFSPTTGDNVSVWLHNLISNSKFSSVPKESIVGRGSIEIYKNTQDTKESIQILMQLINDKTLFYPDTMNLFACGWSKDNTFWITDRHFPPGFQPPPITSEYGGASIAFIKEQSNPKIWISLVFDYDGYADQIDLSRGQ